MKSIILAGGGGTRLWPLSRSNWPKQFLQILGDEHASDSLLTATIKRVAEDKATAAESVYFVCGQQISDQLKQDLDCAGLHNLTENTIVEPSRKNTAPAIALAARYLMDYKNCASEEVMVVLPSDHYVKDSAIFRKHLASAARLAASGSIVTLGVPPTKPDTGYGYIEVASDYRSQASLAVCSFVEKPDEATAQAYMDSGKYLWNAGIFVFSIGTLMDALASHAPAIDALVSKGYDYAYRHFDQMPDISFDYAVMEHVSDVQVVPMRTDWSDVGSWDSLFELVAKLQAADVSHKGLNPKTSNNHVLKGQDASVFFTDTSDCFVVTEGQRKVALLGMEDTVVVDTPDALLISRKGHSQSVRKVVESLNGVLPCVLSQPKAEKYFWGERIQMNIRVNDPKAPLVYQYRFHPEQSLALIWEEEIATAPRVINSIIVLEGSGECNSLNQRFPFSGAQVWPTLKTTSAVLSVGAEQVSLLVTGVPPIVKRLSYHHLMMDGIDVPAVTS